jgi:hypothetical protein
MVRAINDVALTRLSRISRLLFRVQRCAMFSAADHARCPQRAGVDLIAVGFHATSSPARAARRTGATTCPSWFSERTTVADLTRWNR